MKREINPEDIRHLINNDGLSVLDMRRSVFGLLILLVDLFLPIMVIADPFEKIYVYLLVPIIAVLHLFALYIMINPYKRQVVVHLYKGALGIGTSLGSLICAQKIVYGMWGAQSPLFLICSSLGLVGWYIALFRWHFRNLERSAYRKPKNVDRRSKEQRHQASNKRVKVNKKSSFIAAMSTLGIFIGINILRNGSQETSMGLFASVYLLWACLSAFFSISLHRYLLALKHKDWVEYEVPKHEKKKRRKGA